jgi:hypothetical protein
MKVGNNIRIKIAAPRRTFVLVVLTFVMGLLFAGQANAVVVQTTTRTINNGSADFGGSAHAGGGPAGAAIITYDWTTTTTGLLGITGRVRGTLYWDALWSSGCARLTIRYRNSANANLAVRTFNRCGPGGNANSSANKLAVDDSFGSTALDNITLTTAVVQNGNEVGPQSTTITQVRTIIHNVAIENGTADFGDGFHFGGTPQEAGIVAFTRNNNATVTAAVEGIIFWDSLSAAGDRCSRLVIEWRDQEGDVLGTDPILLCGAPGGDANSGSNQLELFNFSVTSGRLAQVRLRVDDTGIAGDASSAVFGYTGQIGNF